MGDDGVGVEDDEQWPTPNRRTTQRLLDESNNTVELNLVQPSGLGLWKVFVRSTF